VRRFIFPGLALAFTHICSLIYVFHVPENNCGGTMGNSATGYGYGCQMPAMINSWREHWSATPGTTDKSAPFGIVTLAAGGSEGHPGNMAGMRWSQSANYGQVRRLRPAQTLEICLLWVLLPKLCENGGVGNYLGRFLMISCMMSCFVCNCLVDVDQTPNPAMPNVFLAHAYDLGDPMDNLRSPCVNHSARCDPVAQQYIVGNTVEPIDVGCMQVTHARVVAGRQLEL
jgi:hypothetical protein